MNRQIKLEKHDVNHTFNLRFRTYVFFLPVENTRTFSLSSYYVVGFIGKYGFGEAHSYPIARDVYLPSDDVHVCIYIYVVYFKTIASRTHSPVT